MSQPIPSSGVCPGCGAFGTVPEACLEGACAERGLRRIPVEFAAADDKVLRDPLVGTMVDNYLVVSVLGTGGMGAVRLAIDPAIGLKVALKTLVVAEAWQDHEAELRHRFLDEARALARVHHPNVIGIHQYGELNGMPYMAMEYVRDGRTLADDMDAMIAAGRWFEREQVARIMDELLAGLAAVHAVGVVHRDVKPENMMLQPTAGRPERLRLVDFGIAKLHGTGRTDEELAGTPEYMAPEQLLGTPVGPGTDLYAAGVVAYELLTDRRPFPFDDRDRLLMAKMDPSYDPTSPLQGRGYPPELLAFFGRALDYEPARRFGDTDTFSRELHNVLAVLRRGSVRLRPDPDGQDEASLAFRSWLSDERERLAEHRERLVTARRKAVDSDPLETQKLAPPDRES